MTAARSWTDGNSPATHKLELVTFIGDRAFAVGLGGTILKYDANETVTDTDGKPSLLKRN